MAALTITSWTIEPLNPDGTKNLFLPSVTGSVPADVNTETIDFLAMGSRVSLTLTCEVTGTFPDSSTASIDGAILRYNPAMFLEYLGIFFPPGVFPTSGYAIQMPASPSGDYTMPLIGQANNQPNNENGEVTLSYTDGQNFEITHDFYMTMDVEGYSAGRTIPNIFRFSKNSINALEEYNSDRPSVYGDLKGLNVNIAIRKGNYTLFAPDLSIPFRASFMGKKSDGTDAATSCEFRIEWASEPSINQTTLSPFQDNTLTLRITDPGAVVQENESELMMTYKGDDQNVGSFLRDLRVHNVKLVTTGSTAQLSGPIYGPVRWSQSAGITEISVIIRGTELEIDQPYQLQLRTLETDGPSSSLTTHHTTDDVPSESDTLPVTFEIYAEFWTRNGEHAEEFTIAPNQRCTNVLSINRTEYDSNASGIFDSFANDFTRATIEILNSDGDVIFTSFVEGFVSNDFIGYAQEVGPSDTIDHFYLKEFRIPYLNEQNLPNWIGETFTFRWTIRCLGTPSNYGCDYQVSGELSVVDYENSEASPEITNIRFLDPVTGNTISNWCQTTQVRVVAEISGISPDVYVSAMVDLSPFGSLLFNDLALEEEDPVMHSLPSYVIFEQKTTDLITQLPDGPEDGAISFLLDVSELSEEQRMRIYIEAYTA